MNIDAQIYMDKLLEILYSEQHFRITAEAEQIDEAIYEENLKIELQKYILDNVNSTGQPMLTEEQMRSIIISSIAQTVVDSLMTKGIVKSEFDLESGEIVYSLTELGKERANQLKG